MFTLDSNVIKGGNDFSIKKAKIFPPIKMRNIHHCKYMINKFKNKTNLKLGVRIEQNFQFAKKITYGFNNKKMIFGLFAKTHLPPPPL